MREEKKSDKIVAIYHAIEELVAEGADLLSMRVSDIAAKAGIGKGTTYEYFSSKEEMIVKAMVYLVGSMVNRIINQMEKLSSFQEKFMMLLDEMEEKAKQRVCILTYLSMFHDMNLCQQMHDVLLTEEEARKAIPMRIIQYLLEEGKKEGILSSKYPQFYMETAMFSRVISFLMFIEDDLYEKDCTINELKQELYAGICRELGV